MSWQRVNSDAAFEAVNAEIEQDVKNRRILTQMWQVVQTAQDIDAMEYLGMAYLYGNSGLSANLDKALLFLELAARGGSATAQFYMAECCFFGIGREPDPAAARKYYMLSAAQDTELCPRALQRLRALP